MPAWISYVVAAIIAAVIAIVLAPYIPSPGDTLVMILGWIVCVVCAILALVTLLRGRVV